MKAHVRLHGNEMADFLAKKGSSIGQGHSEELLVPNANQKKKTFKYFKLKWSKAWNQKQPGIFTVLWLESSKFMILFILVSVWSY